MNPHKIKSVIREEMHLCSDVNRSGGDEGGAEGRRDLDLSGHVQFGGVQIQQAVQSTEDQDRNDDGEITDQGTELEHIQGEQRRGEHGRGQLLRVEVWIRGGEEYLLVFYADLWQ